jgi:hypothetical protein
MFGANPNTIPLKTQWEAAFQLSHYKLAIYPLLARMSMKAVLTEGNILKRTYSSDGIAGDMGGNGSYATTPAVNTEESLTIDTKKYFATQWPSWEKLLWHLENDKEYRNKAIARLVNQTDADVIAKVAAGAGSTLDDGSFGGTTGNGFAPTNGNVFQMFTKANKILRLANTDYPNGKVPFTGNVKIDKSRKWKIAAVDAQTAQLLEEYLGTKNSKLGDDVSHQGFEQMFMGFNVFVSNNLPFTVTLKSNDGSTNFSNSDTIVIAGVTLTAATTVDAGTTAGQFKVCSSLAYSLTNLAAYLNSPFSTVADATNAGYNALTATQVNTTTKALVWGLPTQAGGNISAAVSGTTIVITIKGATASTATTTAAALSIPAATKITQCIFAVTKCIDLIMKRSPSAEINPVSGQIAKDLVVWNLYGSAIYHDQAPQIVTVNVKADTALPTQIH